MHIKKEIGQLTLAEVSNSMLYANVKSTPTIMKIGAWMNK